jgi:hypothetical protein
MRAGGARNGCLPAHGACVQQPAAAGRLIAACGMHACPRAGVCAVAALVLWCSRVAGCLQGRHPCCSSAGILTHRTHKSRPEQQALWLACSRPLAGLMPKLRHKLIILSWENPPLPSAQSVDHPPIHLQPTLSAASCFLSGVHTFDMRITCHMSSCPSSRLCMHLALP